MKKILFLMLLISTLAFGFRFLTVECYTCGWKSDIIYSGDKAFKKYENHKKRHPGHDVDIIKH